MDCYRWLEEIEKDEMRWWRERDEERGGREEEGEGSKLK